MNNDKLLYKLHTEDLSAANLHEIENYNDKKLQKTPSLLGKPKKALKNLYIEKIQGQTLVHSFIDKFKEKLLMDGFHLKFNYEILEFFNAISHTSKDNLGITIN